jgi:hypothetical protein
MKPKARQGVGLTAGAPGGPAGFLNRAKGSISLAVTFPRGRLQEDLTMRLFTSFRAALVALVAIAGVGFGASSALADSGSVSISIIKGGFMIGASAGSGTLTFHGRHYALDIGGLSGGLVIGAAKANLQGTVSHIGRASDVAGVYAAVGAGAAGTTGPGAILLKNEKGALLELHGRQTGLMINADLSGIVIALK